MAGPLDVFHKIFVPSTLEESVLTTLETWLPTYIRYIEGELGLTVGNIPPPQHFSNRNSFDVLPGEKFPKVVAISPGLQEAPKMKGDGSYKALWRLGVGVAANAKTEEIANTNIKIYGAAVRGIMLQQLTKDGIANVVTWIGEAYDDLPIAQQNQLLKGYAGDFAIEVQNVVSKWAGPIEPDAEPYGYGEVEEVIIDVERKEISG